ncbi:MAG: asparaginase [Thermoplasmatota archaeon]
MFIKEFRELAETWEPGKHMVVEERNGLIEAYHDAHVAVVDSGGRLLFSSGDPRHFTYTRSCIKPIQALPLLFTGAADHYGLTDREIAIISGSHSGEPEHLKVVRSILQKADLEESYLKCKGHAPFNKEQAKIIGEDYSPIHDNCSGKHAGALATCKFMGWDLDTYTEFDHPLTKEIVRATSELTGLKKEEIHTGVDGCDIPNFAIPIDKMAHLFALLMEPPEGPMKEHLSRLGTSMIKYPYLVAGTDRFDTVLMNDLSGNVLSKGGAVGLQTVAARTGMGWLGVSVKILDGAYSTTLPLMTYHVLSELGLRSSTSNKYKSPLVKTRSDKVVGAIYSFGTLNKHRS